jgi:hypothetical protein
MTTGGFGSPTVFGRVAVTSRRRWSGLLGVAALVVITLALIQPAHGADLDAWAVVKPMMAVSAAAAAALLIANSRHDRRLQMLLLACASVSVCLAEPLYWGVPALTPVRSSGLGGTAPLAGELAGTVAFIAAAFAAAKPLSRRGWALTSAAGLLGIGGATAAALLSIGGTGITDTVHVVAAATLLMAAGGFAVGSWRGEAGNGLLAGACVLLAGASLEPLTTPRAGTELITPRVGLRLAVTLLLLAGAGLRHVRLRRRESCDALCSDRGQIASNLHDGLAQDLACIVAQGQRLECRLDPDHPLLIASRRALARVRETIVDLTASTASTPEATLRVVADQLERGLDVDVDVRAEAGSGSKRRAGRDPAERDRLISLARRTIADAARHAGSRDLDLVLSRDGTLRVSAAAADDDGQPVPVPTGGTEDEPTARPFSTQVRYADHHHPKHQLSGSL